MRSEEEVDLMIEEMKRKTKGKYITQGVAFNKTCPRQMEMLKNALKSSVSFSGLVKEMLALRFTEQQATVGKQAQVFSFPAPKPKKEEIPIIVEESKTVSSVGNFL